MTESFDVVYSDTVQLPHDWTVVKISAFGKVLTGATPSTTDAENFGEEYLFVSPGDLGHSKYVEHSEKTLSEKGFSKSRKFPKGAILFTCIGSTIGKAGIAGKELTANQQINAIIVNSENSLEYLYYQLEKNVNKIRLIAGEQAVPIINKSQFEAIKLMRAPIAEQKAIGVILSSFDFAIEALKKLIAQKELRKKWLMQNLLTGKKRLKGFTKSQQVNRTELGLLPTDWRLAPLKNIVFSIKKSIKPEEDELYQQIGIRSHAKGIFHKEKVSGKSLGEKSVFWVEPDCLVVNIVFAWEHAIAKTTFNEIGMIASHRFPMFKPKAGILDLDYLLYFFKSLRGKHLLGLASPGGAGRNKTLGQAEFLKLEIPLPSIEEQIAIAKILDAADKEIQLLKAKTEKLREQKKGMMQVLLTGKKRLKI